jgi:PIN domain nuclease of toxin-antitoxin system
MRILLDTHAFLWFITADPKLSPPANEAIRSLENEVLLSIASVWEIAIKVSIGKLPIPGELETFIPQQLDRNRMSILPIQLEHTYEIARMPLHHRDPFDRLLIAQAQVENIPLVSADPVFDAYDVRRLW